MRGAPALAGGPRLNRPGTRPIRPRRTWVSAGGCSWSASGLRLRQAPLRSV